MRISAIACGVGAKSFLACLASCILSEAVVVGDHVSCVASHSCRRFNRETENVQGARVGRGLQQHEESRLGRQVQITDPFRSGF